MSEIIPGLYWFKMPISTPDVDLDHVNVYLARGDDGLLLIDSGWNTKDSMEAMEKGLAEIGADIRDIKRIIVTHVHPDHYGMAGRIKKLSGAQLLMHDIEKGFISSRYIDMDDLLQKTDTMLRANGVPDSLTGNMRDASINLKEFVDTTYPDATLHHGETISIGAFKFTVLWTPGHSSGHLCLYEPEKKVLISGDHILPTISPNVSINPQSIENPLGRYMQSLTEMKQLDVKYVLPGHDVPFPGLQKRIDEIMHHHEQRNREILAALDSSIKTTYQLAAEIPWGSRSRLSDLPDFHKRMAVFETLAHLEMMAAEGRLDRFPRDGVMNYCRT
jgi:glyoxylase-like metal-dependent hydrolase (beta-lactamase superfamily II)